MVFLMIFFIIAVFFVAYDLICNKYWYELKVFIAFSVVAFIMCLFYIVGLPIINPVKLNEYVVKDILHLNYK